MRLRILGLCLALTVLCAAADKQPAVGQAANDDLNIQATLYNDKNSISGLLGAELESGIVVLDVRLTPRGDEPLKVWRDDFFLRSDKDGQKSEPFDPSQIAGSSVITLVTTYGGAAIMQQETGPVWGGVGGPPRRLPGPGGGFGNSAGQEGAQASVQEGSGEPESELLGILKNRVLKEEQTSEPVSGLLYFPLEGKHKIKQLELHYRGKSGKLDLRFKRPKR